MYTGPAKRQHWIYFSALSSSPGEKPYLRACACSGLAEAEANGAEPMHQSASTRDTDMAPWSGWDQQGATAGGLWAQDEDDLQWENTDNAETADPG